MELEALEKKYGIGIGENDTSMLPTIMSRLPNPITLRFARPLSYERTEGTCQKRNWLFRS
jgi:hypothetical protein